MLGNGRETSSDPMTSFLTRCSYKTKFPANNYKFCHCFPFVSPWKVSLKPWTPCPGKVSLALYIFASCNPHLSCTHLFIVCLHLHKVLVNFYLWCPVSYSSKKMTHAAVPELSDMAETSHWVTYLISFGKNHLPRFFLAACYHLMRCCAGTLIIPKHFYLLELSLILSQWNNIINYHRFKLGL